MVPHASVVPDCHAHQADRTDGEVMPLAHHASTRSEGGTAATGKTPVLAMAAALAVLISSVLLFPNPFRTIASLGNAGETILSPGIVRSLLQQTGTPGTGEQVLPPPVRSMLALLRSNRVPSFRYSAAIAANEEIRQRLLEGALPLRYVPTASYLLLVGGEQVPPACPIVASREGVFLVHCP